MEEGEVMPRMRPVSEQRSRSTLTPWMAPLWRARLIAEMTFSASSEETLTGVVSASSKLRWSTVGGGGVVFLGLLVALLLCTTVHPLSGRGGGGGGGGESLSGWGRVEGSSWLGASALVRLGVEGEVAEVGQAGIRVPRERRPVAVGAVGGEVPGRARLAW